MCVDRVSRGGKGCSISLWEAAKETAFLLSKRLEHQNNLYSYIIIFKEKRGVILSKSIEKMLLGRGGRAYGHSRTEYETGLMISLSSKGEWISGRHHESNHNKCMHQPERRTKPHRSHSSQSSGEQKGPWTNMSSHQDYLSSHPPAPSLYKQPAEAGKTYSKEKKAVKFLKLRNNSQN